MKKGYIFSEEHKKHIREARLGTHHSKETRKKLSEKTTTSWEEGRLKKGWRCSKEARKNMSVAGKMRKPITEETRRKLIKAHMGSRAYNWGGGESYRAYTVDWNKTLRRSIRERDRYTCQICKRPQEDIALSVHHIVTLLPYV
jgi:hypothetical protein